MEVAEISSYIFRNDRVTYYIIGSIWKKNHLDTFENKNKNENENSLLFENPNPN
jgi:hypothetical protein